jgi:hypothetical protein
MKRCFSRAVIGFHLEDVIVDIVGTPLGVCKIRDPGTYCSRLDVGLEKFD